MFKVAAIQMCSSHIVDDNLKTAAALIKEAASNDAKLIVLPEMFAIIALDSSDKITVKEPFGNGKIQTFLCEQAKLHRVWIVGGTIPIACDNNNKVRAASLMIDDTGKIVARYDKIHLFDVTISPTETHRESDTIEHGDKIVLVETPFAKIGMAVCYDIRFPELFRYLFNQGAEMFVISAAFTVPTGTAHWELLTRSRAVENFSYVVGACQGGTHTSGRKTYGNSIIVDPWGSIMAKQEGIASGVIYANIDLKKLYDIRKSIPVDQHQTINFDVSKLV